MSGFGRRSNEGHGSYIMNQQVALPIPYSQGESHEFSVNDSGSYHFPSQSFNAYTSQFSSPYSHSGISPHNEHLSSHNLPVHSVPSNPDHTALQHHHHHHRQPVQYMAPSRYFQSQRYLPFREVLGETDIESQDSRNENTMLSEQVIPPLDGFPNVREFDQLMRSYVDDLSIKKQDKALIHAKRARNIRTVLLDPKDTTVESAQFRFWVKKMFKLQVVGTVTSDCMKMICHEGKPVAIREKLFKILTKAHQQCQHGGRDKTSAQVRQIYSWVPKELISRFVKICPTCQVRRGGSRLTPPNSRRSSPRLEIVSRSPKLPSLPISRCESSQNTQLPLDRSQANYLTQFNGHSGWPESQKGIQQQLSLSHGHTFAKATPSLPSSVSTVLDSLHGDLPDPSAQVNYNPGFATTHDPSSHRDF
ncbi:hypothetical protein BDV26DRAFT_249447 [Aspergillus bertholletiae]|uniref:Integrase zinc-binding domain-containing protein n=1 Tax=Aspergillus bertholletiae TaxID=1226010 RepID=A0A5N7B1I7_9EURO|nr:hypothetical protein BDV26DRAFT_249447 [Aspergillus bertholletiae]